MIIIVWVEATSFTQTLEILKIMTKQIKLKVDSYAYEYTYKKWIEIAGMEPSHAVLRLSRNEGIPSSYTANIIERLNELMDCIRIFLPMALTTEDTGHEYRKQNAIWYRCLLSIRKRISNGGTPVFLVDAVNQILKKSKLSVRCTNLILTKYLHMFGEESMTPTKVAETLSKFTLTPWDKIPISTQTKEVSFRVNEQFSKRFKGAKENNEEECSKKKGRNKKKTLGEYVEDIFLFPYCCIIPDNDDILENINNDIQVISEYFQWLFQNKEYEFTPEYKMIYESFRKRLRTIPSPKSSDFEVARRKMRKKELMTEKDQLTMLRENKCPICGKDIEVKSGPKGQYFNCSNHYFAGLRNGQPYINNDNKKGVLPQTNLYI